MSAIKQKETLKVSLFTDDFFQMIMFYSKIYKYFITYIYAFVHKCAVN